MIVEWLTFSVDEHKGWVALTLHTCKLVSALLIIFIRGFNIPSNYCIC
jgi:hypothetical protein